MPNELLRSVFVEAVPAWNRLKLQLREWLGDPKLDLEHIRDGIFQHIFDQFADGKTDEESNDIANEAMNRAFAVVDGLIENLPTNEINCQRLKAYINEMDCLNAYDRLLTDFKEFLTVDERQRILAAGKRCFSPEVTSQWG